MSASVWYHRFGHEEAERLAVCYTQINFRSDRRTPHAIGPLHSSSIHIYYAMWIVDIYVLSVPLLLLSLYRHLHIHIYSGDICIYVHTCRAYVLNWRRILLLRSSHQSFQNSVPINLFIYFFRQKETHNATVRQPNKQAYSANTESRTAIVYVMPWQQTTI